MTSKRVSADFDATYDSISVMKSTVDNCMRTVESASWQATELQMTGVVADGFREVTAKWVRQMNLEITRLGEFVMKATQVVQAMELKETGRTHQVETLVMPAVPVVPQGAMAPGPVVG
ncbi:hypothetical protein [Streptomyces sp. NPDC005125]